MGKHARPKNPARHRKPSAPVRAAAVTAAAATTTATAGIIASASMSHAAVITPPPVHLDGTATVSLQSPQELHEVAFPARSDAHVVQGGETLWGIAVQECGKGADWTGIYMKNRKTIGSDYNLIQKGQQLRLDCRTASLPVVTVSYVQPVHYRYHHRLAVRPAASGGYSVSSGFQACVIRAESGGNSQVMNSSGHYGLYQFSASTWAGHGGNPADFGRASAAEQTQVFWNTVHADGTSDWAPYDGC